MELQWPLDGKIDKKTDSLLELLEGIQSCLHLDFILEKPMKISDL